MIAERALGYRTLAEARATMEARPCARQPDILISSLHSQGEVQRSVFSDFGIAQIFAAPLWPLTFATRHHARGPLAGRSASSPIAELDPRQSYDPTSQMVRVIVSTENMVETSRAAAHMSPRPYLWPRRG